MTNLEYIVATLMTAGPHTLIETFEGLYDHDPKAIPIRIACDGCMEQHKGECPDLGWDYCETVLSKWLNAEAVKK